MKKLFSFVAITMLATGFSADVFADDFSKQIKARQALMQIYAFNMAQLGGMAKGKIVYDAKAASDAANNILAAASMKNGAMWPKGSDTGAPGLAGKTRAKAEIWTTYPKIAEAGKGMVTAATQFAAVAGNGVDALKAGLGGVGKGCKACHEQFRAAKK